jgi:hypothetical protein
MIASIGERKKERKTENYVGQVLRRLLAFETHRKANM